jgi:hypothetical protein
MGPFSQALAVDKLSVILMPCGPCGFAQRSRENALKQKTRASVLIQSELML